MSRNSSESNGDISEGTLTDNLHALNLDHQTLIESTKGLLQKTYELEDEISILQQEKSLSEENKIKLQDRLEYSELRLYVLEHGTEEDKIMFQEEIAGLQKNIKNIQEGLKEYDNNGKKIESRIEALNQKQEAVRHEIKKVIQHQEDQELKAKSFYNARDVDPRFVDRENIQKVMHQYFEDKKGESAVFVIGSLGGMGKTQLALKYIELHARDYKFNVRWIDAQSETTLNDSFKEFAEKLLGKSYTKKNPTPDKILEDVRNKLSDGIKYNSSTLIVFDNAHFNDDKIDSVEYIKLIRQYFPKTEARHNKHHVLITTTRDLGAWQQVSIQEKWGSSIPLESFTLGEAEVYITKYSFNLNSFNLNNLSQEKAKQDIEDLAALFHKIPLGLSQSITYMRVNEISIEDYIVAYNNRKLVHDQAKGMNNADEPEDGHEDCIFTTLSLTFDSLASIPKAYEFFCMLSYLNPSGIPLTMFDATNEWKEPIVIQQNEPMLKHALAIIKQYNIFCSENHQAEDSIRNLKLNIVKLYSDCGYLFYVLNKYDAATEYLTISLNINKNIYGDESLEVATCLNDLGAILENQDDYTEALSLYSESLRIRRMFNDKSNIAASLNNIGKLHRDKGYANQALTFLDEAIEINKFFKGADHISVATNLNNKCLALIDLRQYDEAEPLIEESLRIEKLIYGEEDQNIISGLNIQLGIFYYKGQYEKVLPVLHDILKINTARYGIMHEQVANIYNNIAMTYYQLDKLTEALENIEMAREINEYIFSNNSTDFAHSLFNKAKIYNKLERFEEVVLLLNQAFEIKSTILGIDNPKVKEIQVLQEEIEQKILQKQHDAESNHDTNIAINDIETTYEELANETTDLSYKRQKIGEAAETDDALWS